MSNQLTNASKKIKSFWDTSEGTTGMVVGFGLMGLIGWGLYNILPFIITLLENTLYTVVLGGVLLTLIYVLVIDDRLRTRLWMGYKLLMRALTYTIISYDPVGVLREVQIEAKKRIALVEEHTGKVNGQKIQIAKVVEDIKNDVISTQNRADYFRRKEQFDDLNNEASKLGRLNESYARMSKTLIQMEGFHSQLKRALKAVTQIHENIDFEINIVEREYKATTAAHIAWKSVREAFKGSSTIDEMGNDAWAILADSYSNKLGEIETFMNDSAQYITNVETNNNIYTEEGLKILEELNKRPIMDVIASNEPILSNSKEPITLNQKQPNYWQ